MTFDHFLAKKDAVHHPVLERTRQLLLSLHPGMQERMKWSLPVYQLKKNIAYLDVQKGRPLIGINYAYENPQLMHLLEMGNRTRIGHFYLDNFNEEKHATLLAILDIALAHDLAR